MLHILLRGYVHRLTQKHSYSCLYSCWGIYTVLLMGLSVLTNTVVKIIIWRLKTNFSRRMCINSCANERNNLANHARIYHTHECDVVTTAVVWRSSSTNNVHAHVPLIAILHVATQVAKRTCTQIDTNIHMPVFMLRYRHCFAHGTVCISFS